MKNQFFSLFDAVLGLVVILRYCDIAISQYYEWANTKDNNNTLKINITTL